MFYYMKICIQMSGIELNVFFWHDNKQKHSLENKIEKTKQNKKQKTKKNKKR